MSVLTQMLACPFWSSNLSPSRSLFCQCHCILVRFAVISNPSLISPLIARLISMYFKHRELDQLLASGSPLDRRSFHRILTLGLFDILISLPIAILNILLAVLQDGGTPARFLFFDFALYALMISNRNHRTIFKLRKAISDAVFQGVSQAHSAKAQCR